jgi:hypothetical protein
MLYKVLLTQRDVNGFIGIQLETTSGDGPLVALEHPFGFYSRPLDPDDEGHCTAFGFDVGDDTFAILGTDARIVPLIPEPPKGSSLQYGATGSYHQIAGDTGTQTLYVPYANNAKCQTIQISSEGISLLQGEGAALLCTSQGVTASAPNGSTWYSCTNDEHSFSGTVNFAGSITQSQGVPDSLVKFTPLLVLLKLLAAAIDAKTPIPGSPPVTALTLVEAFTEVLGGTQFAKLA